MVFPLPTAAMTFTMGWCGVRGFEDWFALDGLPFFVLVRNTALHHHHLSSRGEKIVAEGDFLA